MKKYDLSKIMKRAWELVKKAGMTISIGLKKAWQEAKKGVKAMRGSEKQIAWAEDIKKEAYGTVNANIKTLDEKIEKYPNWETAKKERAAFIRVREMLDEVFGKIEDASVIIEKRYMLSGKSIIELKRSIEERM